jgi:repressor LexA
MKHMTQRQKEILAFIRDYMDENGMAPSHEEIKQGLDISSNSAVAKHLAALEKKKKIRVIPRRSRAIQLVA